MTLTNFLPPVILALAMATTLLFGCDCNEPEPESPNIELTIKTLKAETEFGALDAERIDPPL